MLWKRSNCFLLVLLAVVAQVADNVSARESDSNSDERPSGQGCFSRTEILLNQIQKADELKRKTANDLDLAQEQLEATNILLDRSKLSITRATRQRDIVSRMLRNLRPRKSARDQVPDRSKYGAEIRPIKGTPREAEDITSVFNLMINEEPWALGYERCKAGELEFSTGKNSALRRMFASKIRAESWDYDVEHFWVAANSSDSTYFKWDDGTSVRSDAWAKGYPIKYESGLESCVAMGSETSLLYNFDCRQTLAFVCFVPK